MIHIQLASAILLLSLAPSNHAIDNAELEDSQLEHIRSPMLEVLMHLPPNFHSDKSSLEVKPDKAKRDTDGTLRKIVDVRSYEISQPVSSRGTTPKNVGKSKREAKPSEQQNSQSFMEKPEAEKLVARSSMTDSMRGPIYTTYPVKEFDVVDIDDPDDPRKRRNDSADHQDDNSQRDKRTFMDVGGETGETTTPLPFWKRKKENPPFITGRGNSMQKGNPYTPPQHRAAENARESHSLNLDKTVQSNEISRTNPDNFYAATNRRTYSRQSDNLSPSTPKSVYDTIDYNKKTPETNRAEYGRSHEEKKETLRDGRPTHEQYNNRQYFYNHPSVYDRSFYQPPYPYPTEIVGRGVEYYHRTYDPSTGRIIYYANMPEHGRSFDYRFMDPINRNFYVNNRPYFYEPYYRNYVPPYDFRFPSGYGRSPDYARSGRSSSQAYSSFPAYQDREKFLRDGRFMGGFDKGNRLREDVRNKTYIIYDADESRSQFPRTQYSPDGNRMNAYSPAPNQPPQMPSRNFFPVDNFPPGIFPFRNQYNHHWNYNQKPGLTDSNANRPLNSPEIQLPLTTSNRALHPSGNAEKTKKS